MTLILMCKMLVSITNVLNEISKDHSYTFRNVIPWGRSSSGRLSKMSCSSSCTHSLSGLFTTHSSLVVFNRHPGGNSSSAPPGRNTWHPADETQKLRSKRSTTSLIAMSESERPSLIILLQRWRKCYCAERDTVPVLIKSEMQLWNFCFCLIWRKNTCRKAWMCWQKKVSNDRLQH